MKPTDCRKDELCCHTELVTDKSTNMPTLQTVCYYNGKTFKRNLEGGKRSKDAMNEIINYLVKRGAYIDNIKYPEINYG